MILALASTAAAQPGRVAPMPAGMEAERYARALALVGSIEAPQWTVRGFGPVERARMVARGAHPWGVAPGSPSCSPRLIASGALVENTSFPYGFNDGPAWDGKGVTAVASGGATFECGPWSVSAQPIAFIAQNAPFSLGFTGVGGPSGLFVSPVVPGEIDLPQRFGSGAYAKVDPGESHVRWDGYGLTAGFSTAGESWGPAIEHAMILGNHAAGIPRVFAGTSAPVDLRWVTIHGRAFWGRIDQSDFGLATGSDRHHYATAAVGTLGVKGAPGLELGAVRFFHVPTPAGGFTHLPWLHVLQGLLKKGLETTANPSGNSRDNQIASIFFRWAPPAAGIELYGEYGREDHNFDTRDLIKEPDHAAAYLVGFQRAWAGADRSKITVARAEVLNTRLSHLQQTAPQSPWYTHTGITQGHTQRGQALGSIGGFGGGAATFAFDRYLPAGRLTVRWDRIMMAEFRTTSGLPDPDRADVIHALTVERLRRSRSWDVTATTSVMKEFNRHFIGDAWNLRVAMQIAGGAGR